jgi:hypothetical protein
MKYNFEDIIQLKVDELTKQMAELKENLNDVKTKSHYKYSVTGECEGAFTHAGRMLKLSYGAGLPDEDNFGLYVSDACTIHRMTFMSVFGSKEHAINKVRLTIQVVKHPDQELVTSYSFPKVGDGQTSVYHSGFTSEEMDVDIPAKSMIYVYANESNLVDENDRHRLSFEFKTNLF